MLIQHSIFHSRLFTFHAGENGASTTVHSGAVAAISTPLNALMNEPGDNGLKTSAVLHGVREEDLLRFCDFCYTNTYTDPYPVVIKSSPNTVASDAVVVKNSRGVSDEAAKDEPATKRPRTDTALIPVSTLPRWLKNWANILQSPFPPFSPFGKPAILNGSSTAASDLAIGNKAKLHSVFNRVFGNAPSRVLTTKFTSRANENHSNVLIAHAAMYSFGTRYSVPKLQALSLTKLREKLTRIEMSLARAGDVVALVKWTYAQEREQVQQMDELKDLVTKFVVSEVGVLGQAEEFMELLEEGGPFVREFWALIYSSLLSSSA